MKAYTAASRHMGMLPVSDSEFEQALPDFITKQRWYRAKAKTLTGLHVRDVLPLGVGTWLVITDLAYRDGETARYILAFSQEGTGAAVLPGNLHDALHQEEFRRSLLNAIACNQTFKGEHGEFLATHTPAFQSECGNLDGLESTVSRAEQSNSSIIYQQRYILKLFRKLEQGINPDIEVGLFLTEHGFQNTPAVLGQLEYVPTGGASMQAGILMRFVPNRGDAWKYTLDSLAEFVQNVTGVSPKHVSDTDAAKFVGGYIESARLLGRRTAEMHRALAQPGTGVDFAPEPFTPEYAGRLYEEMLNQADLTFDLIRDKQDMLSGEPAEDARRLLQLEPQVRSRFAKLRDSQVETVRIRHHGDYHLGQVLWTGSDFMIIDFEGEPARPLAERRTKTFAMRDVAGMVRSFSYAGHAAMSNASEDRKQREEWAEIWAATVSAAFVSAYLETANGNPFAGNRPDEQELLFDAFLLQKALYEVAYELNNRPDWVQIPLRGILNLIGENGRRIQFA